MSHVESQSTIDKDAHGGVQVRTLDGTTGLGHVPERKIRIKLAIKSLGSREAWFGEYDYASLFIPNVPFLVKKRELPFYGVNDKLPYMLMTILGLQHALAMVGGLITPPLLLAGPAGANLGSEAQQYLVSASLIWCALGTTVQISRFRLLKTKYYLGTGLISVTGTSFAFTNVALAYLSQSYSNGTCPMSADGKTRLPCPDEFGAILGTATLTGIYAIALAFVPPKTIRKLFPPLITGTMLLFIGAALVQSGITNWAGGSGSCTTDHTIKCSGPNPQYWGSGSYLGLGFSSFIVIVLLEIFGSAFMKSSSVFMGLIVGFVIAAATGYFNGAVISSAPVGTFLWLSTWRLSIRGQLVLPMVASWTVMVCETIGNVTASSDVSHLEIAGETFMQRVQGGVLADAISATIAGLATVPPLTTFSQNAGVIALTRNASRSSGYVCAFILFLMGIFGKFGAVFVAAPPSTIGGFTTFLFGSVAVSGIRVLAYAKWTRRDRFIATASFALGLAALCNNPGLLGFFQAVVLIVEEPYLIAAVVGVFLNATLPNATSDERPEGEAEGTVWNEPATVLPPLQS
ncbi:Purine permease [Saitozyma sp. JCM 24511]|nr:Purine permease [Saitozyma sp. JCM 24511]